jgi:hypothetical protein
MVFESHENFHRNSRYNALGVEPGEKRKVAGRHSSATCVSKGLLWRSSKVSRVELPLLPKSPGPLAERTALLHPLPEAWSRLRGRVSKRKRG